jgi:glyoxylase-like metal-dependent hydrolase (beta-lactamase superfamily II)
MSSTDWFAIQRLRRGVYLIAEPMHVNSYLIVGSRRAVLFDTGLGIGRIRTQVDDITDLPITVINSHHHFDHVGGNAEFDDIAVHEAGVEHHRAGPPPSWLRAYLRSVEGFHDDYLKFEQMDRCGFNVLAPEMKMRQFPSDFDPAAWEILPVNPTRTVSDGDSIDLGGRALTVVHSPGHTPDSICLLEEDSRILFSGDTIDTGPLYAHLPGADLHAYARTARRMASDFSDVVDDILCAHGARYRTYPSMLTRVADAFDEVARGGGIFEDTYDCFMDPVRQAVFDDFSVVLPPTTS